MKKMMRNGFVLALCLSLLLCAVGWAEEAANSQSLSLSGVGNARELGGYATEDGRTVKRGVLLRTAKLSNATEEDLQKLTEAYHLSVVIDFRGDMEIESSPIRKSAASKT